MDMTGTAAFCKLIGGCEPDADGKLQVWRGKVDLEARLNGAVGPAGAGIVGKIGAQIEGSAGQDAETETGRKAEGIIIAFVNEAEILLENAVPGQLDPGVVKQEKLLPMVGVGWGEEPNGGEKEGIEGFHGVDRVCRCRTGRWKALQGRDSAGLAWRSAGFDQGMATA